jgi:oligopeptide transport system substrate-binding protein
MTARWRRAVICLATAAALTSACSQAAADRQTAPPVPPGAGRGGTLTVGITDPGAIEPTFASSSSGLLVSSTICDTLVHLDPVTGKVKPGLAESWTLTSGGGGITFKLRRGMRFHGSGQVLTAQDVSYSLTRLADPKEASYLSGLMSWVAGYELLRSEERPSTRLAGVTVVEKYGLQVSLTAADPDAIRLFAHPATAPVSRKAVEANPVLARAKPPCVGPYEVKQPGRAGSHEIHLQRDARYLPGAVAFSGGGGGYADEVVFRSYPKAADALDAWRRKEVDVAAVPPELAHDTMAATPASVLHGPTPHVELLEVPTRAVEGTALDGFDQPEVRRALSLALDRTRIAEVVYGDGRPPADGFVPASVVGGGGYSCGSTVPPTADVAGARRALAEAHVSLDGRKVPFYFNDEFGHSRLVGELAAQWKSALGLEIEPRPMKWDELLDKATGAAAVDGLFRLSWASALLSAESYLVPFGADPPDPSGPNLTRYSTPLLGRMLYRIDHANGDDRRLRVAELNGFLCTELPAIPLAVGQSHWVVGERVATARAQVVDATGRIALRELYVKDGAR